MAITELSNTKEFQKIGMIKAMQNMISIDLRQNGIHATLEEHQQALFYLLCEFDRVCNELHIPYFLFAGTLLGAIRHKGFIPWDDDLDVLMKRRDYDRFLEEAPRVLNQEHFFLQKEFSEHFPMFFSKLRLNGTTCLEKYYPKDPFVHQGVYIDIFPCDNAYRNKIGRFFQFLCSKVVIAKGLDAEGYATNNIFKKAVLIICRFFPRSIFQNIVRGPKETGEYLHCFFGGASKCSKSVFPSDFFAKETLLRFESGLFPAPEKYHELLTVLYGDYMRIPPKEERKCKKHAILVDLTTSYEHYKTYRDGMRFDSYTRSIR